MSNYNYISSQLSCVKGKINFSFNPWTTIQSKILKHIIVNINEAWFDVLDKEKVLRARNRLKKIKCDGLNDFNTFKDNPSIYCNTICRVKEKCSNDEILEDFRKEIVQFCADVVKSDIFAKSQYSAKPGRHAHYIIENKIYFVSTNGLLIIFFKGGKTYHIASLYFPCKKNPSSIYSGKSTKYFFQRMAALAKIKRGKKEDDIHIHYNENFVRRDVN